MPSMTLKQALEAGLQFQRSGQLAQAENVYRQILHQDPNSTDAQHLLGILCTQTNRAAEGIDWIRKAVDRHPQVAQFQFSLATALLGAGRAPEAVECFRRAQAAGPESPDLWANLGSALFETGQFAEAAECARKALAMRPSFAESMVVLGNALRRLGHTNEAITRYRAAIELKPALVSPYTHLGIIFGEHRRLADALAMFEKAAALEPNSGPAISNLSKGLHDVGRLPEAERAARRAIELAPDFAEGYANLALTLEDLGEVDEAITAARRAIDLNADSVSAHNVLSYALKEAGMVPEAVEELDRAATLRPNVSIDFSNKLYVMEFDPRSDAKTLLSEQRKWNERFGEKLTKSAPPHANDRSPSRRLRIGYVSPYFYTHAEAYFVAPLLQHHDREAFEIHCYADVVHTDAVTEQMKRAVDHWHITTSLNDEQLAEKIRADKIDLLIDLTMHMAHNRAEMFARKPAPVQVCWLAYPGGTGLDAIDYRISDPWIDPPANDDSVYAERTIRLPRTWVCFDPLIDLPPAAPREPGPLRYGSFNNPCKLNEPTLRLWANAMRAVPDSRLIVQAISHHQREQIIQIMGSEGFTAGRLEFVDRLGRKEYFRLYDRVDVCLDPLPYNGITTTCDALWMGVPVITMTGNTAAGRASASILQNVGLGEWVASDVDQFAKIAAKLASDAPRLAQLRSELRNQFKASAIMDAKTFARDMEAAYRQIWKRFCTGVQ